MKTKKHKTLKIVLLFVVACCIIGALFGQTKDDTSENTVPPAKVSETVSRSTIPPETPTIAPTEAPKEDADVDANGWTQDDYITFMTITQQISDEYVANYSSPWGVGDWDFAKFDDSGKVMVTTKYTFDNMNEKQFVMCIFTSDRDKFKGHFLSVGDKIYLDDGSCDETLNALMGLAEN